MDSHMRNLSNPTITAKGKVLLPDPAQRPLIDVAQRYCKNLSVTVSSGGRSVLNRNNEMQENKSVPNPVLYTPKHANPYFWKSRSDPVPTLVSKTPDIAVSSSNTKQSPYSWRASPISIPKALPRLTVSVTKDSPATFQGPSTRSPLQSFSPTGNSTECMCYRTPKLILCKSCGEIQQGRLSMTCNVHPGQVFLMDLNCCSSCKSTNLKEICDAKK